LEENGATLGIMIEYKGLGQTQSLS